MKRHIHIELSPFYVEMTTEDFESLVESALLHEDHVFKSIAEQLMKIKESDYEKEYEA